MNQRLDKIIPHLKILAQAFVVSVTIFTAVPVIYYFFHRDIIKVRLSRKTIAHRIHHINLKKKKNRKQRIIRDMRKKESLKDILKVRFKMDLTVLSSAGGKGSVFRSMGTVIDEKDADIPPIKRFTAPPQYPLRAKREGIEGHVVVRILIDEQGNVQQIKIIKSTRNWGFEEAVRDAVKNWQFEPAKLKNLPIRVWATQEIYFRL